MERKKGKGMTPAAHTQEQLQEAPAAPSSPNVKTDFKAIYMDAFINADCHADLSGLIIDGCTPTDEELLNAWRQIRWEFANSIEDSDVTHTINAYGELSEEEAKITGYLLLINALKIAYSAEAVELLQNDYDIDITEDTPPEVYAKEISKIEGAIRTEQAFLNMRKKEAGFVDDIEYTPEQVKANAARKEQQYYSNISDIQRMLKLYPNDAADTLAPKLSVYMYLIHINKCNAIARARAAAQKPTDLEIETED